MPKRRNDEELIATRLGLDEIDVRKIIRSYFSSIRDYAVRLPFDDRRRIFAKDKFEEFCSVFNLPYIGRIGPVYSRYLKWRRNEAEELSQGARSSYRCRMTQSEIETMAAAILADETPFIPKPRKKSELYDSIWIVRKDGKKLAKQVIKKEDV